MAQPVRFQATIEQVIRHTPDVVSYRLCARKRLPRFTPGQFIHLTVEDFDPASFWPESRVFSVANAVADRHTVELTISRQGVYTSRILDRLQQGDEVWAKGPYGEFTIDASHGYRRAVLIAGGTGITPFCAFMDAALTQGSLPIDQVVLHYGARTPDLLIYRALADRCAAKLSGFQVRYYAEHQAGGAELSVRTGWIDLAGIMASTVNAAGTAFFLSGPRVMIDSFRTGLIHAYRLPLAQVLIDAWE